MVRLKAKLIGVAIVLCYIASAAIAVSNATASDADSEQAQSKLRVTERLAVADWGEDLPAPLCGVYAACTALELIGMKPDPRDFIATRYVGMCGGSSPAEVARVVEDSGANARILSRLSSLDLRMIGCPLIANVRSSPVSNRFNHWVVVVPSDVGVTVFDGLQQPYGLRIAEFLGIWSGVGICISRDESSPLSSIWLGRISVFLTVLIVAVLFLPNWGALARAGKAGTFKQFCGLCASFSLVLTVVGNLAFGDLLNHRKGVAVATAPGQSSRYRTGTLDDAVKASASSNALLVDARREQDYRLGTIDGAVNIPVTASLWAINKYLERVNRKTPIVVFCQSASCGYDETIGAQLVSLGFSDVTVCDEGWSEYKKQAQVINSQ